MYYRVRTLILDLLCIGSFNDNRITENKTLVFSFRKGDLRSERHWNAIPNNKTPQESYLLHKSWSSFLLMNGWPHCLHLPSLHGPTHDVKAPERLSLFSCLISTIVSVVNSVTFLHPEQITSSQWSL